MSPSFPTILLRLVENGFAHEALGAASACRAAYWDELLWDHLVHVRSRKQYAFASAPRSRTRVMEAASRGRMDRLSWLLGCRGVSIASRGNGSGGDGGIIAGLLVSAIDFSGRSALHYALEAEGAACAELLVASGAYMFARDSDGKIPIELIYSRAAGPDLASRVTDMAVSGGCSVDRREMHLMLKLAFMHGHVGCVASLVRAGLQLDRKTQSDDTFLWYSGYRNFRFTAFQSNKSVGNLFSAHFRASYVPLLTIIIDTGKARSEHLDYFMFVALELACLLGDEEAVVLLLESGMLPSRFWRHEASSLFLDVFNGLDRSKFGSIARRLVEGGAEVFIKKGIPSIQPLWHALNAFSLEGVRVLIDAGAVANFGELVNQSWLDAMRNSNKRIQPAEEGEVLEVLQLCIDAKLHEGPNQAESMTLLLGKMCYLGHLSCVRFLLEAGASAVPVNNSSWSPIKLACHSDHENLAIIQLLLARGACDENESVPSLCLQVAAEKHRPQVVRALLEKGSPLYTSEVFYSILVSLVTSSEDVVVEIVALLVDAWMASVGDDEQINLIEPLRQACRNGCVTAASYILDRIPSPSCVLLARALDLACGCPDDEKSSVSLSVVRMLLSHPKTAFDSKALSRALASVCRHGHVECMKLLLEAECSDGSGLELITPACFANLLCNACPDPVDALNLLMDRVTDYDTSVGRKAFLGACSHGSYRCVEALLRVWRPAEVEDNKDEDDMSYDDDTDFDEEEEELCSKSPLAHATNSSDGKLLQLLLDHGYGRSTEHVREAFLEACYNCNVEAVRMLISMGSLRLSQWKHGNDLIWENLIHVMSEQKFQGVEEILELLNAHGLDVRAKKIDEDKFITLSQYGATQLLNTLLSRTRNLPRASLIAHVFERIFSRHQFMQSPKLNLADTVATLRAAGADTHSEFVNMCDKSEHHSSDVIKRHLFTLIRSGVNVNARKKDKPVLYLLAANHYDPVLVSLMLQGGARFDEEALVKCVPERSRAELRSLIAHFGVARRIRI